MSIKGNLVGNISPRTNWNQTDSARADYLVGREKIVESIADAKAAGTKAQTAAENAEKNAKDYADSVSQTASTNAKTYAKTYADSKHKEFTATIPAANWYNIYGSVYQNDLTVDGLLGTDKVDVDVFMPDHSTEAMENNMKIEEEFAKIFHIPYGDGPMWVRAREKPEVDIPIKIKVVR